MYFNWDLLMNLKKKLDVCVIIVVALDAQNVILQVQYDSALVSSASKRLQLPSPTVLI